MVQIDSQLYDSIPQQAQSTLSACMPRQCPQRRIQKTSYTRTSLAAITSIFPSNEQLVLLGDSNARVGARAVHLPRPANRQLLLSDEAPAPSYLETPALKGTSGISTYSGVPLSRTFYTRSYHSADCNTDHSSVCCKTRLQPNMFHRYKKQGNHRTDVGMVSQPNLMLQFALTCVCV